MNESNDIIKIYKLKAFAQGLQKFMKNKYKERYGEGLTPSEMSLIVILHASPENDTATKISRLTNISQALYSRTIESLKLRGFLTVEEDEVDRRVNRLTLNIEDEKLEFICKLPAMYIKEKLQSYSKEEQDILMKALTILH